MTISAVVIKDSFGTNSPRLTTLQLRYPKFIHGEFMTHRVFSRNASSSRAIPVKRMIQDVTDDPVYPMHWGKNQPGMQASEEQTEMIRMLCIGERDAVARMMDRRQAWDQALERAVDAAQSFSDAGYHKQIVNRLLEPFVHINVVVTATEWSNFFQLRCHPAAQPEMRLLAETIRFAMERSEPRHLIRGQWHLPYVDEPSVITGEDHLTRSIKVSVARCARVSYLTQEGKKPSVTEDVELYDKLVGAVPLHASPAEHQAKPDGLRAVEDGRTRLYDPSDWENRSLHGNLTGWCQWRKMLEMELPETVR